MLTDYWKNGSMIETGRLIQQNFNRCGFISRKLLKEINLSFSWIRLKSSVSTVWIEMEKLMTHHQAVDIAHGYPDFIIDNGLLGNLMEVSKATASATKHQYTRSLGHPRLVEALAQINSVTLGKTVDPYKNIMVTIGATHGLFCSFRSLIKPGDKVILFSPLYDSYEAHVNQLNALAVFVDLKRSNKKYSESLSSDFVFDADELELKIRGSKCFIFNNPSNPLGKVFTKTELEFIAELCIKHNVTVISDEVYERMVQPPHKHIQIASLPGMWERTVTIGSAGKSFSVTGWKIGWCIGPDNLIKQITPSLQDSVYTCPTPIQEAVAMGLEKEYEMWNEEESCFRRLPAIIQPRVALVAKMVKSVGMKPILPQAGIFLFVDISDMEFEKSDKEMPTKDVQFAKMMITEHNIGVLPSYIFFPDNHKQRCKDFIRFSCFKADDTLKEAEIRFKKWKTKVKLANF